MKKWFYFLFLWLVKAQEKVNGGGGREQDKEADGEEWDKGSDPEANSIFHACSIPHPQPNASFFFVFFTIVRKSLSINELQMRPRRARVTP